MQLRHAPSAFTFSVHISPHISEVKPGPDYSMHILKLTYTKYLGKSLSSAHYLSTPSTGLFHWQAICNESPDIFVLTSRLPFKRDIEYKLNLLE